MNVNQQINKRILVLGSTPHTRLVTAYAWDRLPQDLNIADYDVVILNLVPFLDKEFARRITQSALIPWMQYARLLFSRSEIIVVGQPWAKSEDNSEQSFMHWLPVIPQITPDSGEEIREISPEFDYYFQYVKRWNFHTNRNLQNLGSLQQYFKVVHSQANLKPHVEIEPIAQTRFHQFVAFKLQFLLIYDEVWMQDRFGRSSKVVEEGEIEVAGRVIWLPTPTEIPGYEAINLILSKQYGLNLEQAPPTWVKPYKLPLQLPIEEEITQYQQEIQDLAKKLTVAEQRLQDETRFQKLLYEQGEDALEPIVRDALRKLDAQVHDPQERGREDGRLVDPFGCKGTLEIKGRTGSLRLNDVRQLDQWVRDAFLIENWDSKGILIATLYCGVPPEQRGQFELFPTNCISAAQRSKQCLMTTTQLFYALRSHQRGELDLEAFWNNVFNTNGVCTLSELESP